MGADEYSGVPGCLIPNVSNTRKPPEVRTELNREANKTVDHHVGQQVKKYRIAAGMSQGALADRLGITFQQIQKYEKGDNRIAASRLVSIAEILGVPLINLFEGCPDPFRQGQQSESVQRSVLDAPTDGVLGDPQVRKAMTDLMSALSQSH